MTRNMQAMLGHIAAARASAGTDIRSPTTAAIVENQEFKAERARGIEQANIFNQVRADTQASQMYRDMASRALEGGYLGALGGFFKGAGGLFDSSGSSVTKY